MRRFVKWLPILCTAVLLGTGFFMPRLAALTLDRRLEQEVIQRENSAVSLTLNRERDFFETLELFAVSNTQVELSEGEHRKRAEVEDTAVWIVWELTAGGRLYDVPEVTPVLMTNKDAGWSGVFWRCVWSDSKGMDEVLWLDDQSGKLVALQGRLGPSVTEKKTYVATVEPVFQEAAVNLADFLRLHYPAENIRLSLGAEDGNYTLALLRETDGREVVHSLPLRLRGEWLYFNL